MCYISYYMTDIFILVTYSNLLARGHGIKRELDPWRQMDCNRTHTLLGMFGIFSLINDLNDLLLIIFCRLTDCFSITVEGNTLAVVYLSHNCRTQADVIFVNAE